MLYQSIGFINCCDSLIVVIIFSLKFFILLVSFGLSICGLLSILFDFDADLGYFVEGSLQVVVVVLNNLLVNMHLTLMVVEVGLEVFE